MFDGCASKESDASFLARVVQFQPDIIVQENATASIATDLEWAERLKDAPAPRSS